MSQPWKRWSHKQITAWSFATVAGTFAPLIFTLSVANSSTTQLVLLAWGLLIDLPMILILRSAIQAINERWNQGEHDVFPPKVAARRQKRDAKRQAS